MKMAKAILEFDLNEPDDVIAHKRAVMSYELTAALLDIEEYLRSQTKYNDNLSKEAYDALDATREQFYNILRNRNISFDELIN
jgi:hypothetical protein